MFTVDIAKHVPAFILADKNGYALARAIQAGLQIMNDTVKAAVDCITDYDEMPEWRLDELAWEYDILYDYSADIELKRKWIREAEAMYSLYGTPAVIAEYLKVVYDVVQVEEWWRYDGEPYHFRVTVADEWTQESADWATAAIAKSKNVRSILDNIFFSSMTSEANGKHSFAVAGMEIVAVSDIMRDVSIAVQRMGTSMAGVAITVTSTT